MICKVIRKSVLSQFSGRHLLLTPMLRISGYCTNVFPRSLANSVRRERWTSMPEAWVQNRVTATQIIYSQADTVLRHKVDSNRVGVMPPGLTALECMAAMLDKTKYLHGPL